MDDSHIFVTRDQMAGELASLLQFVLDLLRDYGLDDFYLELSTKPEGKAAGSDEQWEVATNILRDVALGEGLDLVMDPGGGAFYGPKISVQARDAIGRTWQMSTIQLDFNTPARFELTYDADDGTRQTAGDDPPRVVRLGRAILRRARRALRRRVPGVAGAGAGRGAARLARITSTTRRRSTTG